jgi:hypothetical protein
MQPYIFFLLILSAFFTGCATTSRPLETAKIAEITGLTGTFNEGEKVYKVSVPRNDIEVVVDQRKLSPFMGLTSWAAFKSGTKSEAMVAGDLVLFQDEVNPVMDAAMENGLQVTALHNHFFYDEPKVYFMHIGGEGNTCQLAFGVEKALSRVKAIREATPQLAKNFGPSAPNKSSISSGPLDEILGLKGQVKDGMYKAVIGRVAGMPCGCDVGKEMGLNTWAAFAGTDDDAFVDGDFIVLEEELQAVLKSLRKSKINIVAIHHHMLFEQPRYIFLHYYGRGSARNLAVAVKTALSQTKS